MLTEISILKQIVDSSALLSGWSLAVLGGSVAAIVSTSYRRPDPLRLRLPYLLFLPGWAAIGYSLFLGSLLDGKYIAALYAELHGKTDTINVIGKLVNDIYGKQQFYLLLSIALFGLWLIINLLSWIFVETLQEAERK